MKKYIGLYALVFLLLVSLVAVIIIIVGNPKGVSVNLSSAEITKGRRTDDIKKYTQDDFDKFLEDYNNGNLDNVYITEFLFDGVSMYKPYDLDDFIEDGNDYKTKALKVTVYNINTTGDIKLTGSLTGMLAINTNNIKHDINLILDGVNIDTDNKKVPALYVYNKDVTYNTHKVTIKTTKDSQNVIEGGKLKKVSLVSSEELDNYTSKYSSDVKNNYLEYTNYYGVYNTSELNNILFAKVTADKEDLQDGDPYYFYKAAGAISSDIDLYFEGEGTLIVSSKNNEGIETKGNLSFNGGTGKYGISSYDDCLNTTMDGNEYHNSIYINVESLLAVVSLDADEGDAIDSNGTITIDGGKIYAISKPGSDSGLDSNNGTYINGGTIIATGDMLDPISDQSKQRFMAFSFNDNVSEDSGIILKDSDGNELLSYSASRKYTRFVYSSSELKDDTYYLYIDNDYVNQSTDSKVLMGYASSGMQGGMMAPTGAPNMSNGEKPDMQNGEPPAMPNGEKPDMKNGERPEMPDGEKPNMPGEMPTVDSNATLNKEFKVSGISNYYNGIKEYTE